MPDPLAAGLTHEEILANYPLLEAADITGALEMRRASTVIRNLLMAIKRCNHPYDAFNKMTKRSL